MVQKEVIKNIAQKFDLTEKQVEEIINSQGDFIVDAMKEGKSIKISRFGKLVPISKIRDYREGKIEKPKRTLRDKLKEQEDNENEKE